MNGYKTDDLLHIKSNLGNQYIVKVVKYPNGKVLHKFVENFATSCLGDTWYIIEDDDRLEITKITHEDAVVLMLEM